MMLFSDASGRKVVSTTTAETVGKIDDYVVDPSGPTVVAIKVKKSDGDTLRWSDIVAFGADALTVDSAEKITKGADDELTPLLEKRNHMHKKRVLTTTGDEIGEVRDIDFDPATGKVNSLVLDHGEVAAGRLIGVGSYAVVVETESASPTGEARSAPAPSRPGPAPTSTSGDEPTSLDLTPSEPGLTLDPPDLSQAQRASYPPAE